ncbi:protocadherin gamma-B4-like, partial [Scleropages formosus]
SIISLNSGGTQTLSHQQKDGEDTGKYDNQVISRIRKDIMSCLACVIWTMSGKSMMAWQVALFFSLLNIIAVYGQVSYSIPEEMVKGSLVGNIAHDLGLDLKRLKSGNARVYTGNSREYIALDREQGILLIKERIDRESLCGEVPLCALHFQIILENPIEFFRISVEITDINDNAPSFKRSLCNFEISESAVTGAKFQLDKAADPDVGVNGLQTYFLKPTDYFLLKFNSQTDGNKNVEMVLQKPLDREKQDEMTLLLTAMDGGDPPMSGTVQIHIKVLDANDNAPVFTQSIYKATVTENAPKGTVVTVVTASDLDEASNGKVTYSISNNMDEVSDLFEISEDKGEVKIVGEIDYEKARHYQIDVKATDQGGFSDTCKINVDVIDVNDNSPVVNIMSTSKQVPENSPLDTVIAILTVQDQDSENNGKVHCFTEERMPFNIKLTSTGFYSLTTGSSLDRELQSYYNFTVICSDEGVPSLSSSVTLHLQISDVNDNAPVFEKNTYNAYVNENNAPGLSLFSVKASDADWNLNARVTYILEDSVMNAFVSSYVSVNSDTGVVHAIRSFDYEQIKNFQFQIKAQDGGSPPLSSNVT